MDGLFGWLETIGRANRLHLESLVVISDDPKLRAYLKEKHERGNFPFTVHLEKVMPKNSGLRIAKKYILRVPEKE